VAFYVGGITAITVGLTFGLVQLGLISGLSGWKAALFTLLPALCLSQLAVSIVNWLA
jgi:hypothetical protein